MNTVIPLPIPLIMRVAVCALLAASCQAGAADLDANMVLLREVPDRPAMRPATSSPKVVEVNVSPARSVVNGVDLLSGPQLLSDDMLMATHGSRPSQASTPTTGTLDNMSSPVTPGQAPPPSFSGAGNATGGIGGTISRSLAPITAILGR